MSNLVKKCRWTQEFVISVETYKGALRPSFDDLPGLNIWLNAASFHD